MTDDAWEDLRNRAQNISESPSRYLAVLIQASATGTGVPSHDDLVAYARRAGVSGVPDAERIVRLEAELRFAKRIIEAYALECRNIGDYLKSAPDGQGFCGGTIFREWESDMRYWSDRAAAGLSVDE